MNGKRALLGTLVTNVDVRDVVLFFHAEQPARRSPQANWRCLFYERVYPLRSLVDHPGCLDFVLGLARNLLPHR